MTSLKHKSNLHVAEILNKKDFVPLYYQIGSSIKEQILSGKLTPGSKLPPEEVLAQQYGVAKLTLRNALSKLSQEGLIKRYKGKGTFIADSLAGKEKIISLIFDANNDDLPAPIAKIMSGIIIRLNKEKNCRIRVDSVDELASLIEMRKAGETQIDGFITLRVNQKHDFVPMLTNADIPFVTEGYTGPFNSVEIDNAASIQKAFDHLVELGHTRIGVATVDTPRKGSHIDQRFAIAKQIITRRFGPVKDEHCLTLPEDDRRRIVKETREFLALPELPSAMLCTSDVAALAIVTQAPFTGVRVPEDLSVVGFDDMEACRHVHPTLTSMRQDYLQHGYKAAELLLSKISDCDHRKQHFKVVSELVIRQSCAKPRQT